MTLSPLIVIDKIRQAGGSIWSEDQELQIKAPAGLLSDQDRSVLIDHKNDLVPLLSRSTIPVDDPVEREAIVWADTAPTKEIEQALAKFEDLDQWLRENTIEPVPCESCGGLERWEDLAGGWHCLLCDPPIRARKFRERVAKIRQRYI